MHTMAKFLMELCLPDYSMLEYLPSLVAAAALYISNKLYSDGEWVRIYSVTVINFLNFIFLILTLLLLLLLLIF